MKKNITALVLITLSNFSFSQVETWNFQGFSIGQDAGGNAVTNESFMPEVVLINSQYFMYYTGRYNNRSAIMYATSSDLTNWDVQDTIITGSTDSTNREYEIGGSSVIKLNNGQYRMFYRCSQKMPSGTPPAYHNRSLISSDGITWTKEAGVRIEIQPYQSNSFFILAGQSAFYKDASGNTKAVITASDSNMTPGMPSRLYTASSSDEGMTWSGFTALYNQGHDPVVIRDSTGKYHVYFSHLSYALRKAESSNGITWPASADSIVLLESGLPLTEQSAPNMIADLGAVTDASGEIILYSNYKPNTPGPWENIAYYQLQSTSVSENNSKNIIQIFPNPAQSEIQIVMNNFSDNFTYRIINSSGQSVLKGTINQQNSEINIQHLSSGIYCILANHAGLPYGSQVFIKQ